MELNFNHDNVVAFKLINGAEVVGRLSDTSTHKDFVSRDGVIYLEDALFIGTRPMESGEPGLALAPLSGIAAYTVAGKAHMPFALYPSVIFGQFPLDAEIAKMYRQAVSGIALA